MHAAWLEKGWSKQCHEISQVCEGMSLNRHWKSHMRCSTSSCCLLQSHSLTCKKWGYHINLLLICNSLVNDYNFREIFTKADQNNTNTHSHVLHHAWSLEVFEDDDGLEVVQHKDVITRLQGVRTSVRQFICNCQEFLLGLLQDSKAVIQC